MTNESTNHVQFLSISVDLLPVSFMVNLRNLLHFIYVNSLQLHKKQWTGYFTTFWNIENFFVVQITD